MNSYTFKNEIDSIYEKVYLIKESLSLYESKEFLDGFNDGIKEGSILFEADWLGKAAAWAGNKVKQAGDVAKGAVNTVKTAATNVAKNVSDVYQKGTELAKKVWASVTEFANSIYNKVSEGFKKALSYVQSAPGKMWEALSALYTDVSNQISSAYSTLKGKGQELIDAISKIWTDTIIGNIITGYNNTKKFFTDNADKVANWYNTNKDLITKKVEEFKATQLPKLVNIANKVSDVLLKIGKGTLKVTGDICLILSVVFLIGPVWLIIKAVQKTPELYKSISGVIETGLAKVEKVVVEAYNTVSAGVKNAAGAVATGVEKAAGAVVKGAKNVAGEVSHAATAFKGGMQGLSSRAVNFAREDSKTLLKKLKNPQFAQFKDQIVAMLNKRGVPIPATESFRYVKNFENFVDSQE